MSVTELLAAAAAITFLFYGVIPVTGIFFSRTTWRVFRRRFYTLRARPILDYAAFRAPQTGRPQEYRLFGTLESEGENGRLWVRGGGVLVPVESAGLTLYSLTTGGEARRGKRLKAKTGASVFVGGILGEKNGERVFVTEKKYPLVVIFYELRDSTQTPQYALAERVPAVGRRRIEYWNSFTPYSIAAGACILLSLAIAYAGRPAYFLVTAAALAGVISPIIPYLPPGVILTLVFRQLWAQARRYIILSDREKFDGKTLTRPYRVKALLLECASWPLLAAAILVNLFFALKLL